MLPPWRALLHPVLACARIALCTKQPAVAAAALTPHRGYSVVAAVAFSTASFASHLTVFALAVVVGFYVVTGVTHSLHTPLMAQTNAISGIILVGSLLQIGSTDTVVTVLAVVAATFASINIFGGFSVASRMLAMFRKEA